MLEVLEDELVALEDVLGKAATGDVAGRLSPSGAKPLVVEGYLSRRAVEDEVKQSVDVGVMIGSAFLSWAV